MTASLRLRTLIENGLELWLDEGRLHFRSPDQVVNAEDLAYIKSIKPDLLAMLQNNPDAIQGVPLSRGQRALWFTYQLDPSSPAYNLMASFRCTPQIKLDLCTQAFEIVQSRHELLRSTYKLVGDEPLRIRHHRLPITITHDELESSALESWIQSCADTPFDLSQQPPLRVAFGTIKAQTPQHVIVFTLHHLAGDLRAFEQLIAEWTELYGCLHNGKSTLPVHQAAPFCQWVTHEQHYLTSDTCENDKSYWQETLADPLPVLELPYDFPRPAIQTYSGANYDQHLGADRLKQLFAWAKTQAATPYFVVLSVFRLLLSKWGNSEDIILGTPVSQREASRFEKTIGYFVNPVVLHGAFNASQPFKQLLQHTRHMVLDALDHKALPFPDLVEHLQLARDPSRSPLFQVSFVWEQHQQQGFNRTSCVAPLMALIEAGQRGSEFDLTLTATFHKGELQCTWRYNPDLFSATAIADMANHFEILLDEVTKHPHKSLHALAPQSQQQDYWRTYWQGATHLSATIDPVENWLANLSHYQAKPALKMVNSQNTISFEQLAHKAARLAGFICKQDLPSETPIGVLCDRSEDLVTALLACLWSGYPYIPMDPKFPDERLTGILEHGKPGLLLTQSQISFAAPSCACIHLDQFNWSDHSPIKPVVRPPEYLAYIIFTSGSTGAPKGVAIARGAIMNFLHAMDAHVQLQPGSIFLTVTTVSFDIATMELFLPLMKGTLVLIADQETAMDASKLAQCLEKNQVTHLQATPATWRMLVDSGWAGSPHLHMFCGGEALPQNLASALQTKGHSLWNLYGPTEASVWATAALVNQQWAHLEVAPIAGPLQNYQLRVQSRHFYTQPIGVPGELTIAGEGLARGYYAAPSLTAKQFVPNPHGPAGSRVYKTGDLVRPLHAGCMAFLGRTDHQVKIRGFRIELGDIEAAMRTHSAISQAVVITYGSPETSLAAYFTLNPSQSLTHQDLRRYLSEKLPGYMVPTAFMQLETLPLTQNGKLSRRALPKPNISQQTASKKQPTTSLQAALQNIWQEVLGTREIGIDDDFFMLGGHSLSATRIAARVQNLLAKPVPTQLIFTSRTIETLAAQLEQVAHASESKQALSNDQQPGEHLQDATLALAPSQERLWFLEQLESSTSAYLMSGAFKINGPLVVANLREALRCIANRHDLMRLCIHNQNGVPKPELLESFHLPFELIDLTQHDSAAQNAQMAHHRQREAQSPFQMDQEWLWRIKLLRLSTTEHILLITFHHLIADGFSVQVFYEELNAHYSWETGFKPQQPPLAFQYRHAAQLLGKHAANIPEQTWAFWENHLQDAPSLLELPTDKQRPSEPSYQGAELAFTLTADLVTRFQQVCAAHGSTLYSGLHAVISHLLGRHAGTRDVVLGVPFSNRPEKKWEELIGLLIETLPIRSRWQKETTFAELVHQVQHTLHQIHHHKHMPFDALVDRLQPERQLSYSPIFQVLLTLQTRGNNRLTLQGLETELLPKTHLTAKYDLSWYLDWEGAQLNGMLEYSTDLFSKERMQRLIDHLVKLIEFVVSQPNKALQNCALPTQTETAKWLVGWNHTQRPLNTSFMPQLLAQQAQKTPHALALGGQSPCTYQQLNNAVDHLAKRLVEQGIGQECPVGVFLDRSPEMLVSLLAVMRAGGFYVPLDPHFPPERIGFLLQAASPILLLISNATKSYLPPTTITQLRVDGCHLQTQPLPLSVAFPETQPNQLAYTIYTSGSTGNPKGVGISQLALLNFLQSMQQDPGLTSADHLLAVTTVSFDIAGLELFLPLMVGATLTIAEYQTTIDAQLLAASLEHEAITVMQATPATWRMLKTCGWKKPLRIWCGGEALAADLAADLIADNHLLWNLYGPTETTIWSGCCQILANHLRNGHTPVGGPIANTQFFVLDDCLQPVPEGSPGQLFIGGLGLARGYQALPGKTAGQFLPNPFTKQAGERMYGTGDLVRMRDDKGRLCLEFLGRMDHQVKLRGFRIELGDIETHLNRHELVDQAIAMVVANEPGTEQLIAFVKTQSEGDFGEWLSSKLPAYMIPSKFIKVDHFPMTPNGKVNRGALSKNAAIFRQESTFGTPPQTDTEKSLASIWQSLLDVKQITREASFFRLGGHSLLATQMLARVFGELDKQPTLAMLFKAPVLKDFASQLDHLNTKTTSNKPQQLIDRSQPQPLSSSQKRIWFLQALYPTSGVYNMPGALNLMGSLDKDCLFGALNSVIARHESLRTVFRELNGEPQAIILPENPIEYKVETLPSGIKSEAFIEEKRVWQVQQPFDLGKTCLRASLLEISDRHHVLLVTLHHILADGWSLQVLIRDLIASYQALKNDSPLLPALEFQYADAMAARADLNLAEAKTFWNKQLANVPTQLELPVDYAYPKAQTFAGDQIRFTLPNTTVTQLTEFCYQKDITLFMGLLAAYNILLYRHTGQKQFMVGNQIANRSQLEEEAIIGLFTNTICLATDFSGNPTLDEYLGTMKATCSEALQYGNYPLEVLLEDLNPKRQLARNPLFQVAINLQNTPRLFAKSEGLQFQPLPQTSGFSKVELFLEIEPSDQGLHCCFEFNTDVFKPETIAAWAARFTKIVSSFSIAGNKRISEIPMLSQTETGTLVHRWNQTQAPTQTPLFIQAFQNNVTQTPSQMAAWSQNKSLTYAELDKCANHLAHQLIAHGTGRETLVGLCCDRSLEMLIGLLAIQKAGGVYVPIDPDYPQDRVQHMLEDSGLPLLLTQKEQLSKLPKGPYQPLFLNNALQHQAERGPQLDIHPDQLAYVIYTSGSTNKPKGVQLSHRNLANFLNSMRCKPGLTSADRLLAVTTLSFDIAALELYLPLLVGGSVIIADRATSLDGQELARLIEDLAVTAMQATPNSWRLLQAAGFKAELKRMVGGEALPADLAASMVDLPGSVWNMYGPTETTIWSATRSVCSEFKNQPKQLTAVSGPIANTQLLVLDAHMNLVPSGTPGQLFIGGLGLARGYRSRPDLTATAFCPNPFSGFPGDRLYATGDLVRLVEPTADAPLPHFEFLGRMDHQVKIRGFRVELGEIETKLHQHPLVLQAVANVISKPDLQPSLVAYVVTQTNQASINTSDMRAFLSESLPAYMLPEHVMVLEKMPKTPNGKINRNALPEPDLLAKTGSAKQTPLENDFQRDVALVWENVLQVSNIGPSDNFFDLGGTSFLLMQVRTQLRKQCGIDVSVLQLLEHTSVAQLASWLETGHGQPTQTSATHAQQDLQDRHAKRMARRQKNVRNRRR